MWLNYLTYILLLSSVISLWIPSRTKIKIWELFFLSCLILSLVTHIADPIALLSILVFYFLVASFSMHLSSVWRYLILGSVLVLGLTLELHLIPGFHNLLVLKNVKFGSDALPFSLYLNLDKTIVGLIILGLTLNLASSTDEWKQLLKQVACKLPIAALIILPLSFALGFIKFEPKLPQYLWIWIIANLFFTCVAEEGLFRGFFQESLNKLTYRYSEYVAIIIPALLFGIIHFPGGIKYVILATLAGIIYGWVYKVTKRIEASILTHFLLNLTHILLFTYPALIMQGVKF